MHTPLRLTPLVFFLSLAWLPGAALGSVRQVPEGGRAIPVVARGVICTPVGGGWTLGPDGRSVKPPGPGETRARSLELKTAEDADQCAASKESVTVIATGAFPNIDAAATTFYPDDGRVELKGQRLANVIVGWFAPPRVENEPDREGEDLCLNPSQGKQSECNVPLPAGLPTHTSLYWLPPHAKTGADVITYDVNGRVVDTEWFQLRPGRIILTKPLLQVSGIDLSKGPGTVALSHPEAVASEDCGASRCELSEGALTIRNLALADQQVNLKLRLVPRVFLAKGESLESSLSVTLPVLSCPLVAEEGTVLRDAEDSSLVLRMDPSCTHDPKNLLWTVNGERAEPGPVVKTSEGTYVLLRTAGTTDSQVTITAASARIDATIVASTTAKTLRLPLPRASLELHGYGSIDFIPTNRPAQVQVSGTGGKGRFVLLPLEGAYSVSTSGSSTRIQGDATAGGFANLRFAYRVSSLPGELGGTDLAQVTERVQRAVREASVPTDISKLFNFICADDKGVDQKVEPSRPYQIPYAMRHSCRVVIHRDRLKPEEGNQEVVLKISVTTSNGSSRAESQVEQRMLLRPGNETRVVPIQGNLAQFDRVMVLVSHVADESRYALSASDAGGLPAAQWSAIVEGGHLRLYATATIPAGLYRVNEPSGQLTLNFGVLSRLALLNDEGQERLVGIELGVMGLGLIPQTSNIVFPPTLAVVGGIGLRVPLGPGAAVGVQAWVAREFRGDVTRNTGDASNPTTVVPSSHWSFVFGPSISIGNIGFNL